MCISKIEHFRPNLTFLSDFDLKFLFFRYAIFWEWMTACYKFMKTNFCPTKCLSIEYICSSPASFQQCFFLGVKSNFYGVQNPRFFWIFAREKNLRPWKIPKNPPKVRVKITFYPWKFLKITPVKIKLVHVKNNRKKPRQKGKKSAKIWKCYPWNRFFCPWKKMKKCPWKKIMRVKKPKKPEKSARENEILRVKKTKNWQKKAFTPTFFGFFRFFHAHNFISRALFHFFSRAKKRFHG